MWLFLFSYRLKRLSWNKRILPVNALKVSCWLVTSDKTTSCLFHCLSLSTCYKRHFLYSLWIKTSKAPRTHCVQSLFVTIEANPSFYAKHFGRSVKFTESDGSHPWSNTNFPTCFTSTFFQHFHTISNLVYIFCELKAKIYWISYLLFVYLSLTLNIKLFILISLMNSRTQVLYASIFIFNRCCFVKVSVNQWLMCHFNMMHL
jgi:hypothetical protein